MITKKLSAHYKICAKLVLDTSYPDVSFDAKGICNCYNDFFSNVIHHWHKGPKGRAKLERMVALIKKDGRNRDFDCIMGISGGADSSYMLHMMVKEYDLRPLVFHVDGGWNTETATNNIHCLVEQLGLDLYTEVIDWGEMRDFQLAMFKSGVPHLDIPQDMAFIGVLYKFAEKHKIRHILNGGNISTECVDIPLDILYWGTDMMQIKDILRKFGTVEMKSYPFSSIYYHKIYLRYFHGVKVHKPLNYITYIKRDAMDLLEREYGWKPYPQKHYESRFTRFFEGWWLPTRFGFDMRRREFSSLILTGQMTRDEALKLLEKPALDPEVAEKEFQYVATKLGISIDELRHYHSMPKKFYWDYANQKWIFDIGEKVLGILTGTVRGGAY